MTDQIVENPNTHPVNIEEEMKQSYMDYAMSVIVGRALPSVRDGMKPVQRRVLYAMYGEGLLSNRKHSKCAGVVGEVLKRLHPHGDSSVYEALVRLAQPWNLRYPLVDGQGNFGSIDGDSAAAYRYTECRMTALAERMLQDLDKDTVDFIPNFDDSNIEPVVLPAVVPNLLINGADGIAVGMATHIPPHNLREVCSGVIAYIDNPRISVLEMLQHIPGPDFPTGGIIYGRAPIVDAYSGGKGVLQLRARTEIETIKSGNKEVEAIVVKDIPYQINRARLIERIAELVNEKTIEGIARLRDEADRNNGMRIVIELKRDATAEVVLNQLFKLTPLQTSFGIINLAIVDNKPVICSLIQLISHFVDHRRDVVTRRTLFDLRKAEERMHILEGFRIVLLHLDEVIQLIRSSETPEQARHRLCEKYNLSEIQAQAVLDLRLQKLTGMERLAIEQEFNELAKLIEDLRSILADAKKVDAIIKNELIEIKDKFGDDRRTEIVDAGASINLEDLIEDEEMVVSVSHKGYMKRISASTYRSQKRGGKGVTGASQKDDDDFVEHLFVASSLANLLVFTTLGRVYALKVYEIPEAGRTARGRAIVNILQFKPGEQLSAILPVRQFNKDRFIFMTTRAGVVKKMELMDFAQVRRNGIIACSLDMNDALIGAAITAGKDEVILATRTGMSIRFSEDDVRAMGRTARGVRGVSLEAGDQVVSMTIVAGSEVSAAEADQVATPIDQTVTVNGAEIGRINPSGMLLTVCENGYGKRTALEDYRVQGRAGKGLIDIQTEDRNGPVVGACAVTDESGLMLITSAGKVIRISAKDISVIGRNTKGVRLIGLDEGEKVVAVAPLMDSPDEYSVGVIGLGNWGTALAQHLARKGLDVLGWTIDQNLADSINQKKRHTLYLTDVELAFRATLTLEQILNTKYVILALPSAALSQVVPKLKLTSESYLISAVKGFEFQTALTPLQFISREQLRCKASAVLSGPSFARDIVTGLPAGIVLASSKREDAIELTNLFASDSLKVYYSTDVIGVELGGAVKNVIALAAGLSDGLKLGDSARAGLITRGLAEMTRLGVAMGADQRTFYGLSGLGDLVMTCSSDLSRNRRAGLLIGQGVAINDLSEKIGSEIEGLHSAALVARLSDQYKIDMPIVKCIKALLNNEILVSQIPSLLLSRPAKAEFE